MSPGWMRFPTSSHTEMLMLPVLSATLQVRTSCPSFVFVTRPGGGGGGRAVDQPGPPGPPGRPLPAIAPTGLQHDEDEVEVLQPRFDVLHQRLGAHGAGGGPADAAVTHREQHREYREYRGLGGKTPTTVPPGRVRGDPARPSAGEPGLCGHTGDGTAGRAPPGTGLYRGHWGQHRAGTEPGPARCPALPPRHEGALAFPAPPPPALPPPPPRAPTYRSAAAAGTPGSHRPPTLSSQSAGGEGRRTSRPAG